MLNFCHFSLVYQIYFVHLPKKTKFYEVMKKLYLLLLLMTTLSIACMCCGSVGAYYDGQHKSLWRQIWWDTSFEFRNIFGPAPYWNAFNQNDPALSKDILVQSLQHDAEIHHAHWADDTEDRDIVYYKDRRGRCIMLTKNYFDEYPEPADNWHYIRLNGLVSFDWLTLLADLSFVLWIYVFPFFIFAMSLVYFYKNGEK